MGPSLGPGEAEQTLGAYLASWLAHVKARVRAKTYQGYEGVIRLYAEPGLGDVALSERGADRGDYRRGQEKVNESAHVRCSPKTVGPTSGSPVNERHFFTDQQSRNQKLDDSSRLRGKAYPQNPPRRH